MFAVIINTDDYTNVEFFPEYEEAEAYYDNEAEAAKENFGFVRGCAFIEIIGKGSFQLGMGFDSEDGVGIIACWSMDE